MQDMRKLDRQLRLVILFAILAAIIMSLIDLNGTRNAIAGIRAPIQTDAEGFVRFELDGFSMRLGFLYSYDIEGLAVHTKNYSGWDIGDKLGPKDVALAWGKVAEYNKTVDFHWEQSNRWVSYWLTAEDERIVGSAGDPSLEISNNHLIPADDETWWKVKLIRTGDHVRIKGYLVNADGYNNSTGQSFVWHSSTTRYDTGDHSCEVIYVTDVEWL